MTGDMAGDHAAGDGKEGEAEWEEEWDDPYDPRHYPSLEPVPEPVPGPGPGPGPEPGPEPDEAPCWNCGHPLPGGTADCPVCLRPRAHLVLRLDTPDHHATACPGEPLRLGRDPQWASPETAAALSGRRGVSGKHAFLTMDDDGMAWVTDGSEDGGSRNGTWLNDCRIGPPGKPHRLRDGDRLSLGRTVRGTVHIRTPP